MSHAMAKRLKSRGRWAATGGLGLATLVALGVGAQARVAGASVNVEKRRAAFAKPGFTGALSVELGFLQGNVNVLDVSGSSRFGFGAAQHYVFLFNDSAFAARALPRSRQSVADLGDRSTRFKNRHMGHLRYGYRVLKWMALEALTQLEMDEFLLLRTRFVLGATPRFTIHENRVFGLYAGPAYLAEYEELDERTFVDQPGTTRADNWWHRFGGMVTMRLTLPARVELYSTTYVQPRFDAPQDMRVYNEGELALDLTERLRWKLVATVRFDSRPPRYCVSQIPEGGACDAAEVLRLLPLDVGLDSALSFEF